MKFRATQQLRRATACLRLKPAFLIIGAQRAGTSSLYRAICQHADVLPARKKEIHYFDHNFERGTGWYAAQFPLRVQNFWQSGPRREAISGEASPEYLFYPFAARRVLAAQPDIKLIALLRNPVDRAYSQYQRAVRRGWEDMPFKDAVAAEPERTGLADRVSWAGLTEPIRNAELTYLSRGLYARQLAAWLDLFPREQFYLTCSENFFEPAKRITDEIWDFLGLDLDNGPTAAPPRLNRQQYEPLSGRSRRRLTEFFRPHNERLFELLGERYPWDEPAEV